MTKLSKLIRPGSAQGIALNEAVGYQPLSWTPQFREAVRTAIDKSWDETSSQAEAAIAKITSETPEERLQALASIEQELMTIEQELEQTT